jgi:hypothetical protein
MQLLHLFGGKRDGFARQSHAPNLLASIDESKPVHPPRRISPGLAALRKGFTPSAARA